MGGIIVIDDPKKRRDLFRASQQWAETMNASVKIVSVIDESIVRDTTRAIGAVGKITKAVKCDFIKETEEKINVDLKDIESFSPASINVMIGNIQEELKKILDSDEPDLIVMSSALKSGVINITAEIIGYSKANCFVVTQAFKNLIFDKIVLTIDNSKRHSHVVNTAFMFAQKTHGLLYVINVIESNEEMQILASHLIERMYAKAREMVNTIITDAQKRQISAKAVIKEGSTPDIIIDFSCDTRPDIIIMGSHNRTGLNRIFIGSVADRLIKKVGCPILIVKQEILPWGKAI